jgi:RNA polymerase sigma-70 factor (ECF subfamily)
MIDPLVAFEGERGRLFGIAYRMLGTVSEAEDVLQDAWIRWHGVDHAEVSNTSAFLVRLVTRLCLDALGTAYHRRTEYIGPWLPQPFLENGPYGNPSALQDLSDDLSTAFLLLLERLSPVERAVFLLREPFGYSYKEIGEFVGKSEAACRQIERRARQKLDEGGRPAPADPAEHDRLLRSFLQATREGDVQSMVDLLARDAVLYSDGGGKVHAARKPVAGPDLITRFLLGLTRLAGPGWEAHFARINGGNGGIGALLSLEGQLHDVMTIEVEEGKIKRIFVVVSPDKLPPTPGPSPAERERGNRKT